MIEFTVEVVITKIIKIQLADETATPEFHDDWKKSFWNINGTEDIAVFAAEMAAEYGAGTCHDGIGLLGNEYHTHPRKPDTFFQVLDEFVESEIIKDE